MWSTNKNNNNCNLEIFPINENTSNNISNNFTLTNRISNEKSKIASTINDINKTISLYSDKNKNINLEKFIAYNAYKRNKFNEDKHINDNFATSFNNALDTNNDNNNNTNQECCHSMYNITGDTAFLQINSSHYGHFDKKECNKIDMNTNNNAKSGCYLLLKTINDNKESLLSNIDLLNPINKNQKDIYYKTYKFKNKDNIKTYNNNNNNNYNEFNLLADDINNININEIKNNNLNKLEEDRNIAKKLVLSSEFKDIVNDKDISQDKCMKYLNLMKNDYDFKDAALAYFKDKYRCNSYNFYFNYKQNIKSVTLQFLDSPDVLITKVYEAFPEYPDFPKIFMSNGKEIDFSFNLKYVGSLDIPNNSNLSII